MYDGALPVAPSLCKNFFRCRLKFGQWECDQGRRNHCCSNVKESLSWAHNSRGKTPVVFPRSAAGNLASRPRRFSMLCALCASHRDPSISTSIAGMTQISWSAPSGSAASRSDSNLAKGPPRRTGLYVEKKRNIWYIGGASTVTGSDYHFRDFAAVAQLG